MPPFLYDIPQATDQLSISQGNLLNNMGILGAIAGNATANSASLNATVGFNFVNFALPGAAATTSANQMALYTGANANTTRQELYVVRQNSTLPVPITGSRTAAAAYVPAVGFVQSQGWTYLPSGVLMVWGCATTGASTHVTIAYNSITGFPGFATGGTPQVTRIGGSTSQNFMLLTGVTLGGFTTYSTGQNPPTGTNYNFNWMAIGI